jgi:hypothetical protein
MHVAAHLAKKQYLDIYKSRRIWDSFSSSRKYFIVTATILA